MGAASCELREFFMRDLRAQLRELEQKTKRKVPVMVRIPEATLDMNLMEGLDLRTWVKEGWVDEIALDPLWIWDFDYPDTAEFYLELARTHGVKLYGGTNTTAGKGMKANARAFLERISRNYAEGVDGIALFQTDAAAARCGQLKGFAGPAAAASQPTRSAVWRLGRRSSNQTATDERERALLRPRQSQPASTTGAEPPASASTPDDATPHSFHQIRCAPQAKTAGSLQCLKSSRSSTLTTKSRSPPPMKPLIAVGTPESAASPPPRPNCRPIATSGPSSPPSASVSTGRTRPKGTCVSTSKRGPRSEAIVPGKPEESEVMLRITRPR